MSLKQKDFAILDKLGLELEPVAVGFFIGPPDGIKKLELDQLPQDRRNVCNMPTWARETGPFYSDLENTTCGGGTYVLGLEKEAMQPLISGEYGSRIGHSDWSGAIKRIYSSIPRLLEGQISYIAFSTLSKLSFQPDLLLVIADPIQTQIILRAMSYRTGELWESKRHVVLSCGYVLSYPYLSGELNYMACRHAWGPVESLQQGKQLISIPYDLLHNILRDLQDMPWTMPSEKPDGPEFRKRVRAELGME